MKKQVTCGDERTFSISRGRTPFSSQICKFFLCIATEEKPPLGVNSKICLYGWKWSEPFLQCQVTASCTHTRTCSARGLWTMYSQKLSSVTKLLSQSPQDPKWPKGFSKLRVFPFSETGFCFKQKNPQNTKNIQPINQPTKPPRKLKKITSILMKQFHSECFVERAVFHVALCTLYLMP